MASGGRPQAAHGGNSAPHSTWSYPMRFCRICHEEVAPTVTMYPPGVPIAFQRPIVEYKNEDEYGRLIKPCLCKGGMRYIHELCLQRSRTENNRAGSMWKCHTCGHKFNFQKLTVQRFLSGRYASGILTVVVMLWIMFTLGFVADPIINFYIDPYDVVMGNEPVWRENRLRPAPRTRGPGWLQHFTKGFISMGLVGFLKILLANPWNWWNLRQGGMGAARTTTTGRDRAVNFNWIMIVVGVVSAFYFFYRWVQAIIQKTLQQVGNNIVDTQLPGDDDDIKPPAAAGSGHGATTPMEPQATHSTSSGFSASTSAEQTTRQREPKHPDSTSGLHEKETEQDTSTQSGSSGPHTLAGSWPVDREISSAGRSSAVEDQLSQGWTFADI